MLSEVQELNAEVKSIEVRLKRLRRLIDYALDSYHFIGRPYQEEKFIEGYTKLQNTLQKSLEAIKNYMTRLEEILLTYQKDTNSNHANLLIDTWIECKQANILAMQDILSTSEALDPALPESQSKYLRTISENIVNEFNSGAQLGQADLRVEIIEEIKEALIKPALITLKNKYHNKGPSCFISYSWGNVANVQLVHRIAQDLRNAGIDVKLDIWDNTKGSIQIFIELIEKVNAVIVMGTPDLKKKWGNYTTGGASHCNTGESYQSNVVAQELELILNRLRVRDKDKHGIIKVFISGWEDSDVFPYGLSNVPSSDTDFRNINQYVDKIFNLLTKLTSKDYEKEKDKLKSKYKRIDTWGDEKLLDYYRLIERENLSAQEKLDVEILQDLVWRSEQPLALTRQPTIPCPSSSRPVTYNITKSSNRLKYKTHFCNVPSANKNFIGRGRELDTLRTYFLNDKNERSERKIKTVIGPPGIGKTQLTKAFVHDSIDKDGNGLYAIVGWINSEKGLRSGYTDFARILLEKTSDQLAIIDAAVKKEVDSKLSEYGSWLLVFDTRSLMANHVLQEVDTASHVLQENNLSSFYPDVAIKSKGDILIVSNRNQGDLPVSVKGLDRIDAIVLLYKLNISDDKEVLKRLYGNLQLIFTGFRDSERDSAKCLRKIPKECINPEFNEYWTAICDFCELAYYLGDYPLALVQADAWIKATDGTTVATYLKDFLAQPEIENDDLAILQGSNGVDNYGKTMQKALRTTFTRIKNLSDGAIVFSLLSCISYLYLLEVPFFLISHILTSIDPNLRQLGSPGSSTEQAKIISYLRNCLLISRKANYGNIYDMPRIVQIICYKTLTLNEKRQTFKITLRVLNDVLKYSLYEYFDVIEKNESLIPHVKSIYEYKEEIFSDEEVQLLILSLILKVIEYYEYQMRAKDATKEWLDNFDSYVHDEKCTGINNVAHPISWHLSLFRFNVYFSHFWEYFETGNYEDIRNDSIANSKKYIEKAENNLRFFHNITLGEDNLKQFKLVSSFFYHQRGNISYIDKNHENALHEYDQALAFKNKLNNLANIAYTQHGMGNVHVDLQQYPEAEKLFSDAKKNKITHYSQDKSCQNSSNHIGNRDIARTQRRLAAVLSKQNKLDEAITECDSAINILRAYYDNADVNSELKKVQTELDGIKKQKTRGVVPTL